MANEAFVATIATEQSQQFQDMAPYCMKKTFSDVVLIVGEERIYAHKIVLAARCKFFETSLSQNLELTELSVATYTIQTIKAMLNYLYTGTLMLELSQESFIFDLLVLSHEYMLPDLEKTIIAKIGTILDMFNIFAFLNKAEQLDMDAARDVCYQFIDEHVEDIFKSDGLIHLPQKSLCGLLQRRTFEVPEIEIFTLVQKWCGCNEDVSARNLVLQNVSLMKLSIDEILEVVHPSNLVEEKQLWTVMTEIRKQAINNMNIATVKNGASVITGCDTSYLLAGNTDETKCAYQPWNYSSGITIDLGKICYFNNVKFRLKDNALYV